MPVISEASVVSEEITRLGVRRPKTHPQFVHDLWYDLEHSAGPLWPQILSLGPSQLFASLGISGWKVKLGRRGICRLPFPFCAWPFLLRQKLRWTKMEREEAPQEDEVNHPWTL